MKIFFPILLLFFSITLNGQNKLPLKNWEFLKSDLGNVWEGVRDVPVGSPQAVPIWEKVTLPHCYNAIDAVDPDQNYYQGPAWYRTILSATNPYSSGRTIIKFKGSGQKTEVYIYTKKVGSHVGGYDEWELDITDQLEWAKKEKFVQANYKNGIPLLVRCDNSRDVEMIPSNLSDFNVYGGLYREVDVVFYPSVYLRKMRIFPSSPDAKNNSEINVEAQVFNPEGKNLKINLCIKGADGKVIGNQEIETNGNQFSSKLSINKPNLWSPNSPFLYNLTATIINGSDSSFYSDRFGVRSFEFKPKGPFYLNGERLLLRGTHRHEDHAGLGAAMPDSLTRREMVMMKQMGVNFIRLAHYQQNSYVLDLCDSLGIMVWEEIPWCRGGLGGEKYKSQARAMLTNMITQHYNHPAVIIWGLGNENDWPGDFEEFDQQKIRQFMSELNELSHLLDISRKTAIRRCDFCKDIVDIYSPSIWAGWYRGKFTDYRKVTEEEMQKTNYFLHVEWGADSHSRRHSEDPEKSLEAIESGKSADERAGDASLFGGGARVSKDGDWTETYACNLIDWHLKEQETMPSLSGTAYWPFKDFSTPVRPDNPIPYMNQKGVVERDLAPKESFYVFQSYWAEKPMVHIYGHTWPVRWGKKDEKKMVKVYSNCEEAELFLNGVSQGVKKRNSQDYPAAGLRWIVQFKEGENRLKVIARKNSTKITDEISQYYETRTWDKPATIELKQTKIGNGVTEVEVLVKDKNGVACLDAKNWIRFGYTGEGKLLDNLGTVKGSKKVQLANGRAWARVNTTGGEGVLFVAIDGCPPQFITVR